MTCARRFLPDGTKRCTKCEKDKAVCEFGVQAHRYADGTSGPTSQCRACLREGLAVRRAIARGGLPARPRFRPCTKDGRLQCTLCRDFKFEVDFHRQRRRPNGSWARASRCRACVHRTCTKQGAGIPPVYKRRWEDATGNLRCAKCQEVKPTMAFTRVGARMDGTARFAGWCKRCYAIHHQQKRAVEGTPWRDWQESPKAYKARRGRLATIHATPDGRMKGMARTAVAQAVHCGVLAKPDHCGLCGRPERFGRDGRSLLYADHWHGYDRNHWLDVRWICSTCDHRHGSSGKQRTHV